MSSRRHWWPASRERCGVSTRPRFTTSTPGRLKPRTHLRHVTLKALLKPRKLTPVGVQSNAAQSHAQYLFRAHRHSLPMRSASGQIENFFHHGKALAGTHAFVGRKIRRHRLLPAHVDGIGFDLLPRLFKVRRAQRENQQLIPAINGILADASSASATPASPATPRDAPAS